MIGKFTDIFNKFFFFKIFFCVWIIYFFFKSLLNLLQYCFCFVFWFFDPEACGILAPQPGIEPESPALQGEVLTTGPPRKSQFNTVYSECTPKSSYIYG